MPLPCPICIPTPIESKESFPGQSGGVWKALNTWTIPGLKSPIKRVVNFGSIRPFLIKPRFRN